MDTKDIKRILDVQFYDVDRFGRRYPYKITHADGSIYIGSLARTDISGDGTYNEICFKVWDDPNLWLKDADYLSGKMKCFKPEEISTIDVWLGY